MNKEFSKQRQKMLLDSSDKTPHFGFRKLGIGLASMLLSTTLFLGGRTANVHADTVEASANESNVANESDADDFARPTTDASTNQTVQASANSSSASVQEEPTTNAQASTNQTVQASANTSNTTAQPDYSSQSAQPTTSNYSAPVQQNNSTTNAESNYYNSNNSTVNPATNYSDSASYQAPTAENTNTDQSTPYNNTAYDPTASTDNTVNPTYNYASYQAQDNANAVNAQKAINDTSNDISKTDEEINKASEVSKLAHNISDDVTNTVSNNIQDMSDNIDTAGLDVTEKNKHIQNADTDNGYQYQTFYLNNNNNDYNDDNDFSVSDDPVHAAALQLASKPLLSNIFNTSLIAVNSSTGTFDTDATHRADAPEGAVYVLDPENVTSGEVGPNGIYENPVTHAKIEGKMLWPDPSTLTITLWVQDASGKKSKRSTTTVTVTYSRSMFFDKDGKFIGYGVKTDKDSDRPITINGYTLDEYISQRIGSDWKKRYKISDDSAKAIDDWVVTRGTPNKQLDITLVPTETKAVVKFYDITNNPNATGDNLGDSPLVATDTITGVYGTRINYDTNAKMKTTPSLQGYKLAGQDPFSNGFPKNLGEEPEYIILVKKVPQTTQGKVTRHINYDVPGETPPTPIDQPVNITKTGDKVTPNGSYPSVKNPVIPGYHTDTPVVPKQTPGQDGVPVDKDTSVTVHYKKNGKIVPVDPEGNPIPNVPNPPYETDPDDPTKVKPDEPTPNIPGYIPDKKTVTPDNPDTDTNVPYHKIGKIVPIDKTTGDPIPGAKQPQYTPDPNDPNKVLPDEPVPDIPGYLPTTKTVTPDDPTKDTNVPYLKIGKIVPVDPDGNPIPGAKQPHYTPDPNDPTKVEPNEPVPTVPGYIPTQSTVTPDDPAKDTNVPYVKIGKIVPVDQQGNPIPTAKQPQYTQDPNDPTKVTPNEPVPDVKGYTPVKDQKTPGYDPNTNTVTPVDPGKDTKVVYKMDDNTAEMTRTLNVIIDYTYGKTDNYHKKGDKVADDTIMPPLRQTGTGTRDPKTGHLIPNNDWTPSVNTIKYDTENFPKVEGYEWTTPSTEQKGNDYYIHVKYYPTDKQNVNVTINYVDEDDNNKVLGHENIKSQVGERFFNPKDDIKTYTDKGYELDQNNVPTRNYTKDDNGKTFTVTFKHGTTTVNPDKPGKPGEPINPNDPDGPKWPDGSDKDSLQKTGTQTITYTGAGDNTPPKNTMHTTFNHELVIDNVTGKVVADHGWTPGTYTFDKVTPPEVKGYHTTRQTVGGKTVTPDKPDATDTVEYVKNAPNSTATTVTFVDTTTGKPIDTKHFHGKPGDPINYTTKDNINDFIKKGYKVINDETKGQPLTFGEKDQKYVVTLGHQTENVTRNKSVTRHIKYVVPNGYTAPKDVIQILTFKDHGVKDLVTGKTAWDSDKNPATQTFAKVDSPEIKGTTPNMKQVDQKQLSLSSKNWDDQLNENIIVTYVANPNNDNIGKPDGDGNNHQEPNIDQATPNGDAEKIKPAKKTQTPVKRAPASKQAPAKSAPASKQAQNNEHAKSNPIAPRTVQAATIDAPAKSAPAQAPAKSAPAEQRKSLPQTGEASNSLAALAVGSLLLGMSAMGLYESKRKRKA